MLELAAIDVLERVPGDDSFVDFVRTVDDAESADVLVAVREREVLADAVPAANLDGGVDSVLNGECLAVNDPVDARTEIESEVLRSGDSVRVVTASGLTEEYGFLYGLLTRGGR
jgi:hypothetical protein